MRRIQGVFIAFASLFMIVGNGISYSMPLERVSVTSSGQQATGLSSYGWSGSFAPAVSSDGRFVVFESFASNLVSGDTNETSDIFLHDRDTGTTASLSISLQGLGGSGGGYPAISSNGRYVVFESDSDSLVPNDTNDGGDVFLYDAMNTTLERVSVTTAGGQALFHPEAWPGFRCNTQPAVSADGNVITFMSFAVNLVEGDTNSKPDIYLRDRVNSTTERVSVSSGGQQGLGGMGLTQSPSVSGDGQRIVFQSDFDNLVPNDTNDAADIFLRDRTAGTTTRISVSSTGQQATIDGMHNYDSTRSPYISRNGQVVAFLSGATNLTVDNPDTCLNIYIRDLTAGTTERICGLPALSGGYSGDISAVSGDGRYVGFNTNDNILVTDTDNYQDEYIYDRELESVHCITCTGLPILNQQTIAYGGFFADFGYVFSSAKAGLVDFDTNGASDVFFSGIPGLSIPADINNDGNVDLQDVLLGLQVITGELPSGIARGADVSGDDKIGLPEVLHVLQKLSEPGD